MITYPECQACDCKQESQVRPQTTGGVSAIPTGTLSYFSVALDYQTKFEKYYLARNPEDDSENITKWATISSQAVGGFGALSVKSDPSRYKIPFSEAITLSDGRPRFAVSKSLPMGERINLFNQSISLRAVYSIRLVTTLNLLNFLLRRN